jgi:hypothetical protein
MSFTRPALFVAAIALSPIPGPSCSRTTIYNHHHCFPICHRKHHQSQPILVAWRRVLSRSRPLEPEEGVPVWRILESHTRLVLVHGARRRLQIDTDPPRLRSIYNKKIKNMQNMHNMTWFPRTPVLFQHRNIGTVQVLHASVCPCIEFKKQ